MTKIEKRFMVKAGMTLEDVFKNGSNQQKKIACVFDSNSDGKFDEKEARLFNATSTSEDADRSITFWTRMSSGKKIKNVIKKDNLQSEVLTLEKCKFTTQEQKNGKLYRIHHNSEQVSNDKRKLSGETYIPSEGDGMKLVSKNPLNGQMKFESENTEYEKLDGKGFVKAKDYIITDVYGRVIENKVVMTAGESCCYDGYTIQKGNLTTHYSADNKKVGSVEIDDSGKEKVMDKNGNILYYVKDLGASERIEYYDKDNKLAFVKYTYYGEYGSGIMEHVLEEYDKEGNLIKSGVYDPDYSSYYSHVENFNNLDYFRPDFQEE